MCSVTQPLINQRDLALRDIDGSVSLIEVFFRSNRASGNLIKQKLDNFNRLLISVSMETTVFGAGLGMCVLVVVFFLYMNRKWCFSNTSGNFSCCDEKSLSTKTIHSFSKYQLFKTKARLVGSCTAFMKL